MSNTSKIISRGCFEVHVQAVNERIKPETQTLWLVNAPPPPPPTHGLRTSSWLSCPSALLNWWVGCGAVNLSWKPTDPETTLIIIKEKECRRKTHLGSALSQQFETKRQVWNSSSNHFIVISEFSRRRGTNRSAVAEGLSSKYTVFKPKYSNVNNPQPPRRLFRIKNKIKTRGYQSATTLFRLLLWRVSEPAFRYKAQII